MFVRLSVFAGGSTVEAFEAVCNADGELDVVEALAGLVDKSLVQQTEVDGEARFGMLETIREYALEQLDLAGQGDWVRARHAEYFASLAAQTEDALRGPDQARMLQRFTAEHENFRSVLSWALEGGRTDLLVEMAGDLRFYWWVRGSLSEARMWLDAALSHRDGARPEALANVLSGAGNIAVSIGDYRAARGWHEECLAVRRAL